MRVLLAIFYFLAASLVQAHSVHMSTAEAEYHAKTKKLEVSLTVFVSDLELALVRQSEREMRIDKTPAAEFDAQIQAYLPKTFVVTDAAGRVAKLEWVGRAMDEASAKSGDPAVVLFFELAVPEGLKGAAMRNAVFQELFKDEMNLLHLREGDKKIELLFTREQSFQELGADEAKQPKN